MARSLEDAIQLLEDAAKAGDIDTDKIRRLIKEIKPKVENLKDKAEDLKDKAEDVSKEIDRQVREKPWMAVGIVAVVALFLGFIMGRKD